MTNQIDEIMRLVDDLLETEHTATRKGGRAFLKSALEAALKPGEPVAWMSPGKERLEFSRADTVYGSHTIPLYTALPEQPASWPIDEGVAGRIAEQHCLSYETVQLIARQLMTAPPAQTPVPPRLTEQEINHCIKFPSAGSAITRDGSTSQRIARAIESAVRRQFGID